MNINMFSSVTHSNDVLARVRDEMFIISSLLMSLEICGENRFAGSEEEAAVLIEAARSRVTKLINDAEAILCKDEARAAA